MVALPDPLNLALWKVEVTAAAEAMNEAEELLSSATLVAPMDGLITSISVDQGDRVQANATIVEIADPSKVEMDGIVDEIDVLSIKGGAAAKVTLDALPGRKLEGELIEISPVAQFQQGVVSFPVRIRINLRNTPRAGDEIADRAKVEGILAWEPVEEPYPVGYYCGVTDPDGNIIEFSYGQPLGPGAA